MSYAKAEDVKKLVDGMLESSKFDKRVRVDIDVRTNSVIVEATPADLSKVVSLVERVDLQTPQVKVASRIVEVLRSKKNLFGIDWSGPIMGDQGRGLGFGNLVFPNYALSTFAIDTGAASNSATGTGVNLHLGSINNSVELDARLRMEESLGTTNILQNNNVIVADNEKATIKVGRQDFFVTPAAGEGQNPGFNVVDYLLVLQATPHITADGAIQMNVEIESSSPVAKITPDAQASRSQRLLQTSFIKQSGETAAIGGLYTTEVSEEVFGVPILSKIPIIGALFRSSKKSDDRRELIVLVTPTVISGLGQKTGPTVTQASNQGEFNSFNSTNNISNSGVPGNVTASQLGGNYDYGENGEYTDGTYENQQNGQQEEVNQQYGDYEDQGQEAQQQSQQQGQYQNQTYQDQQGTQQQQGYEY
ncbi:MAG: secretin N-terminal domain-containing protein [Bdellovibrionota bacterium]